MSTINRSIRRLGVVLTTLVLATVGLTPAYATGSDPSLSNSVTITIAGGDANALAFCANAADEGGSGDVNQTNVCKNKAVAVGGDVILKNVSITTIQANDSDGNLATGSNTVDLTIRGGDANALAGCLNLAKERGKGDVNQKNFCKNKAYAEGGDVVLKNVDILIAQENLTDGSAADVSNSVTLTIAGGDANALAFCLNAAKENYKGDVNQKNLCRNTAIAQGGSVYLKNVTIDVFQTNVAGGDLTNADNSVDITIRGGDANALAACVNLAKERGEGDVNQKNFCKNKVYAQGGNVYLKNVEIFIIQDNLEA